MNAVLASKLAKVDALIARYDPHVGFEAHPDALALSGSEDRTLSAMAEAVLRASSSLEADLVSLSRSRIDLASALAALDLYQGAT